MATGEHREEVTTTKPREEGVTGIQACQHLDLGLPAFRTRGKQVLFKPARFVVLCYSSLS